MYENVGVDEEGMYGVIVVQVSIASVGVVDREHIDGGKDNNEEGGRSEDEGSSEKEESSEDEEDNNESGSG
jgi:hypothetical protein